MNIDATAEITKFDLPPIPRFLCAYVGDEWVIVARETEACKKHFAEQLEWFQSSKRPHAIVAVNATPKNYAGEIRKLRHALRIARHACEWIWDGECRCSESVVQPCVQCDLGAAIKLANATLEETAHAG